MPASTILPGWAIAAAVARLATVGDSQPHLVPVVFCVVDGAVYIPIDGKRKTGARLKRLDNIARNPRVSLLIDEYDDDWSNLRWIRIDGTAAEVASNAELRGALTAKYPQYRRIRTGTAAIRVEINNVQSWSA